VCFGNESGPASPWTHKSIDSRDCRIPNKELIQEWIDLRGRTATFVRVRVRGLPPAADELQFIDRERIKEAQARVPQCLDDDPLVCGVDVSGGGAAWNVAAFRRGGDARSIPRIRIPGEHTRDRNVLVGKLSEILRGQAAQVAWLPPCSSIWPTARRSMNACARWASTTSTKSTSV
jgi:hypothetical protein